MTTYSASILRLLGGLALALPLFAHADADFPRGPDRGMPHRHARHEEGPPFLRGLQLDEAQRDKVFAIMHNQAPQMREQHKAVDKARQALTDLVRSGQYSDIKAKPIADTLARATAEIALMRARSESQILALLTPEQRARLAQMRQQADDDHPHPPERPPMR